MAKNFNPEALADAKRENRKESKKFNESSSGDSSAFNEPEKKADPVTDQASENTQSAAAPGSESTEQKTNSFTMPGTKEEPIRDEFKERYDAYFKSMGGVVAGDMVVNLVDDLKTNFLYLYAKKNGIDVPKESLQMDPKSKSFAAFLVDEAIKNNFFTWIKKYPLLAALAVIVISGGSTFLMLQMLKKSNNESKEKDNIIEKLKKEKQEAERRYAETVKDLNETDVREFIKKV